MENGNNNPIIKWKSNLKVEVKVHLKIGKKSLWKAYEKNVNWGLADKKVVCTKTTRRPCKGGFFWERVDDFVISPNRRT